MEKTAGEFNKLSMESIKNMISLDSVEYNSFKVKTS